jgi:hypothetical protein
MLRLTKESSFFSLDATVIIGDLPVPHEKYLSYAFGATFGQYFEWKGSFNLHYSRINKIMMIGGQTLSGLRSKG